MLLQWMDLQTHRLLLCRCTFQFQSRLASCDKAPLSFGCRTLDSCNLHSMFHRMFRTDHLIDRCNGRLLTICCEVWPTTGQDQCVHVQIGCCPPCRESHEGSITFFQTRILLLQHHSILQRRLIQSFTHSSVAPSCVSFFSCFLNLGFIYDFCFLVSRLIRFKVLYKYLNALDRQL